MSCVLLFSYSYGLAHNYIPEITNAWGIAKGTAKEGCRKITWVDVGLIAGTASVRADGRRTSSGARRGCGVLVRRRATASI
jgi:hypothetical protein